MKKTLVLLIGSMRSGTTLLKALLAESPDVSHLPEIDYRKYRKYNKYRAYCEMYHLSKKRIIILKFPQYTESAFKKDFLDKK